MSFLLFEPSITFCTLNINIYYLTNSIPSLSFGELTLCGQSAIKIEHLSAVSAVSAVEKLDLLITVIHTCTLLTTRFFDDFDEEQCRFPRLESIHPWR